MGPRIGKSREIGLRQRRIVSCLPMVAFPLHLSSSAIFFPFCFCFLVSFFSILSDSYILFYWLVLSFSISSFLGSSSSHSTYTSRPTTIVCHSLYLPPHIQSRLRSNWKRWLHFSVPFQLPSPIYHVCVIIVELVFPPSSTAIPTGCCVVDMRHHSSAFRCDRQTDLFHSTARSFSRDILRQSIDVTALWNNLGTLQPSFVCTAAAHSYIGPSKHIFISTRLVLIPISYNLPFTTGTQRTRVENHPTLVNWIKPFSEFAHLKTQHGANEPASCWV